MITATRIMLAVLMLAPVFSPVADRALAAPGLDMGRVCCCREGMNGTVDPALPCGCEGQASCILMREAPAALAAFIPSSPYRPSLDLWAGSRLVGSPTMGVGRTASGPAVAKPPPGPLFLLTHVLLI